MKLTQHGMTFIEVLVALFIMVTGILGAVAMQATAKKASFDAMQRSLASSLTQDIIERMRGNNSSLLTAYAGTYGAGKTSAQNCDQNTTCNAAQLAAHDVHEWEQSLIGANITKKSGGLASVTGCIAVNQNRVDVTISWEGREKTRAGGSVDCGTSNNKRRQVSVRVFIY